MVMSFLCHYYGRAQANGVLYGEKWMSLERWNDQIISLHSIYQTTVADSVGGTLECSAIGVHYLCYATG